jgi:transcriptional regulator with XRE-family HTH domain
MAAAKPSGSQNRPISPELRDALARNLKQARLGAGLTQQQLGTLANVSRDYISQIETSRANVSLDVLGILAKQLSKSPLDLLAPPKQRRHS